MHDTFTDEYVDWKGVKPVSKWDLVFPILNLIFANLWEFCFNSYVHLFPF